MEPTESGDLEGGARITIAARVFAVLMLAAAAGAALLGEWAEGAFLLFLFSLGHAGEHYALDRARNAVNALGELMPKTARVRTGDEIIVRPVEEVAVGDVGVVRPGDRIPVDGEIVRGASAIDQSAITGESVPVDKGVGDDVFAGTINQENALDVEATKLAEDNTLSRVMQMVAEAQEQQSPTQQFTQRFTAWFVPAVLLFVVLVIIIPPLLGWADWEESFYRGMLLLVAAVGLASGGLYLSAPLGPLLWAMFAIAAALVAVVAAAAGLYAWPALEIRRAGQAAVELDREKERLLEENRKLNQGDAVDFLPFAELLS